MLTRVIVRVPAVPATCEVCAMRGVAAGAAADAEPAANIAATPAPSTTAVAFAMMLLFMVHLLQIGAVLSFWPRLVMNQLSPSTPWCTLNQPASEPDEPQSPDQWTSHRPWG